MKLLVTYMELRAAPAPPPLRQPEGALQLAPERLSYQAYLSLYRDIGGPYSWDQRLRMPAAALADILSRPTTVAFVMREAGRPVGLCEFDAADPETIELTHFGLVPEVYGRRLGPFLLDSGLRAMWTSGVGRIWLRTDTNDHPRAQKTYERAGFRPYLRQVEELPD
ncbi:GNAT family N-acetyltransferase [Shinella daejeonensis]|uniref:GNAT family N-acetyltransferase n=1 Tax=Shinella daejeonensis TaxID=659017 RepID=UPI0020C7DF23|nr:GNAT family N-acetyltransferase [Shinella daejeonensis]